MKKFTIIGFAILGVFAGCSQPELKESKEQAYKEWRDSRTKVYLSLAQRHYQNGQIDNARMKVLEVVKIDPELTDARLLLARIHIEQGFYKDALNELTFLVGKLPNSGEVYYLTGVALEKEGRYGEALRNYQHSYELDPSTLAPIRAGAEALIAMGHVKEAQAMLEKHIRYSSNEPGTYELAGRIAMLSKEPNKAARYFRLASEKDPRNLRYPEMVAKAYFEAGMLDSAARGLQEISSQRKDDTPAWVFVMLGDCYLAGNKLEKAREAFQNACRLDAEKPGNWASLGKTLLMLNQTKDAINASAKARRLDPSHYDGNLVLSYALLKDKRNAQAIKVLKRLKAAYPKDQVVNCLLAKAYQASGKTKMAQRHLSDVLRENPDNRVAKQLLAKVQK